MCLYTFVCVHIYIYISIHIYIYMYPEAPLGTVRACFAYSRAGGVHWSLLVVCSWRVSYGRAHIDLLSFTSFFIGLIRVSRVRIYLELQRVDGIVPLWRM